MKPMLAHIFEPHRWPEGTPCYIQPKLNGVRALYQGGFFQSREELPWPKGMLEHLAEPLRAMFPDERTILDGELYVHGWPLQRINQAVAVNATVRGANEDTPHIQYWVFDSVSYQLPFYDRFKKVSDVIADLQHSHIMSVTTALAPSRQWVEDFYTKVVSDGFEGIMYRLGDCWYTKPKQLNERDDRWGLRPPKFLSDKNNRVWHLLKRKDWQDDEFECVGVEEGIGKRSGMVGAFICALPPHSLDPFNNLNFRVGSGITDREARHYLLDPPIGRKIKVKFLTYTSDGVPFNPTIEAIL